MDKGPTANACFAMEVREALGLVDAAASVGVTEPTAASSLLA